jgi:hypothetical protein
MLETLSKAAFTDCLGHRFRLDYGAASPLEVELIEAAGFPERLAHDGQPARRQAFSLIFRGPKAVVLPQRIYRLENDDLGTLEIFLVPIGPDSIGMRYQAIFN